MARSRWSAPSPAAVAPTISCRSICTPRSSMWGSPIRDALFMRQTSIFGSIIGCLAPGTWRTFSPGSARRCHPAEEHGDAVRAQVVRHTRAESYSGSHLATGARQCPFPETSSASMPRARLKRATHCSQAIRKVNPTSCWSGECAFFVQRIGITYVKRVLSRFLGHRVKAFEERESCFYPCLLIWLQGSDIHEAFMPSLEQALLLYTRAFSNLH